MFNPYLDNSCVFVKLKNGAVIDDVVDTNNYTVFKTSDIINRHIIEFPVNDETNLLERLKNNNNVDKIYKPIIKGIKRRYYKNKS